MNSYYSSVRSKHMTKVHPNVAPLLETPLCSTNVIKERKEEIMTVWRKSLLFNGEGFTVYDCKGNLSFRVDNYSCGRKGEIVLMDAFGVSLLTLRRKKISLGESWLIFEGGDTVNPRFLVRKRVTLLPCKKLAHVTSYDKHGSHPFAYTIEGSYTRRACRIVDGGLRVVGEVRRKESDVGVSLGGDVFRLVVDGSMDKSLAMAMVIVLEQMYR